MTGSTNYHVTCCNSFFTILLKIRQNNIVWIPSSNTLRDLGYNLVSAVKRYTGQR